MVNLNASTNKVTWGECDLAFPKPEKPKPLSLSANISMTKGMRKKYQNITRIQPDLKYPKRKRAWRLVRKWFNRYQKPSLIGATIIAKPIEGTDTLMIIESIKISKGRPGIACDITAKPQK